MIPLAGYFIPDFRKHLEKLVDKWEKRHNLRPRVIYVSEETLNRLNKEIEEKGNMNGKISWILGDYNRKMVCLFKNTTIETKNTLKYGEFELK